MQVIKTTFPDLPTILFGKVLPDSRYYDDSCGLSRLLISEAMPNSRYDDDSCRLTRLLV